MEDNGSRQVTACCKKSELLVLASVLYVGVLIFVLSGNVNIDGGNVWGVGSHGYGWSRTAVSSTNARYLDINPTDVNPSNSTARWVGLPLR